MRTAILAIIAISLVAQVQSFTKDDFALVVKGFLENIDVDISIYSCLNDVTTEGDDLKQAIELIKSQQAANVQKGLTLISTIIESLPAAMQKCKAIPSQIQLAEQMIKSFKNPKQFVFHIAKNILVNGVQIFDDIMSCVSNYEKKNWENFGKSLGDAMLKILVGTAQQEYHKQNLLVVDINTVEQVFMGILESIDSDISIYSCLHDSYDEVQLFEQAVQAFEAKTASDIAHGLELLAEAVKALPQAMTECKALPEQIKNIEDMIKAFGSPRTFVFHIAQDILVNGVQIFQDIEGIITDYHAQQWESMGKHIGDALLKVFVGKSQLEIQQVKSFTVNDLVLVFKGFLEAINQDISIYSCIHDVTNEFEILKEAVQDIETKEADKVLEGLQLLSQSIKQLPVAMQECKAIPDQIKLIEDLIKGLSSPQDFVYHIAKDIIVNRVQIYKEVTTCVDDYKNQQWEDFGKNLGAAMLNIFVGK